MDFPLKDWADIIKAASASPLGIIALSVMAVLAALCYLFRKDSARVRLCAFGLLVGFAGYAVAIVRVPSKPETLLISSGTIRNASHEPIEDAVVTLTPSGLSPLIKHTGSDGFFSIALPKEARGRDAELLVAAKGYRKYVRTIQAVNGDLPLDIPPLEPDAIKRQPPPPPGGSVISGRIVADDGGLPVDHATVTLLGLSGSPPTFFSDSEGAFSYPVKGKKVKIQVLANGFLEYSRSVDLPAPIQEIRLKRKP